MFLDEARVYPEIKKYILSNSINTDTKIVTESDLEQAFGDEPDKLQKIMSGRHDIWFLEEIYD